mmetsp:Transcript_71638/g.192921  ORF Transcript_71638/g.192921 Transcript_71638/m.192921 type:complete len:709 (+) Transcript_71638:65-2191(+)
MARFGLRALGLGLLSVSAVGHPMEKVIDLLKDLATKAENEGKTEEVSYTKFEYWCTNNVKDLNKAITEEKATMEKLSDEISAHEKNIEVLDQEIKKLAEELLEQDKTAAAALEERKAGEELYKAEKASLQDTIGAVGQAITILTSTKKDTDTGLVQAKSQVRSLLALIGFSINTKQRQTMQAFVEDKPRPELEAAGDRKVHIKGYAFKSDSVIELLKELETKFEDELVATEEAETNAINNYDLAKNARDALVKAKQEAKATKEKEVADSKEDLIAAFTAFDSTQADLAADTKTLSETEQSCRLKASEWEERSTTRAKEIEAIQTAISILAKATGVRTEAPGNPVPPPSPVAFLQVSNPRTERALRILRQEAKSSHSKALERLADDVTERVKHGDGHFDQVVNMVEKMIFRLMHEQTEEDDHKNWCDQEISKTESSITDKKDKVDELNLKIEDAQARAAKLAEEVRDADAMVLKIVEHMKEATEIREIGKKENKLAVKDSEDAQTALANAIAVLKDFYKSSGGMSKEAWEFVQAPVTLPDTPSTWDSGYTSVTDPAAQPDGIVSVLEKVSADFAQMESQTLAQEESDQEAFEEDIKDCKIEMARRSSESEQKAAEEKRTLEKERQMEATRKSVSGEKEATEKYMEDLQPACVEGSSTYEDRKAARAQEVEALKEAQGLLQKAFEEKLEEKPAAFLRKRSSAAVGALRMD